MFYGLGSAFGYGSEQDNVPILVGLTGGSATVERCQCVWEDRKFQKEAILEFSITEL